MNIQSRPDDAPPSMSIEAFFRWAERREGRYELVDGVPHLLPWVKRNHNRIAVNIVSALARQIDTDKFEIATGDFAVTTGPQDVRFADVMVETAGGPGDERVSRQPIVLVEILSPSTMHVDFGSKLHEYLALPTLDTYLLIDQDRRHVWQWTRGIDGSWPEEPIRLDAPLSVVSIDAIGAGLSFEEIYRNVG